MATAGRRRQRRAIEKAKAAFLEFRGGLGNDTKGP